MGTQTDTQDQTMEPGINPLSDSHPGEKRLLNKMMLKELDIDLQKTDTGDMPLNLT